MRIRIRRRRPPTGKRAPCSSLPGPGAVAVAVSAAITGLTANTTYHFRISATNPAARAKAPTKHSKRCRTPPTVVTKAASSVNQTTATLNATVNPNGGEVDKMRIRIRRPRTPTEKPPPCASLPGSGTSPVAVSAAMTGLSANTTYHFRISATNPGGTSKGSDETFKTLPNPPAVVTKAASSITQTTATLNATVNPNGGEVSKCEFEYGTTNAYGKTRLVLARCRGRATAPWRCPRRSRASAPTPPTTSGSPRPTPAARAKALTKRSKRSRTAPPKASARASRPRTTSKEAFKEPTRWRSTRAGTSGSRTPAMTACSSSTPDTNTSGSSAQKAPAKASSRGIRGIATNAAGDVYVSDYANDRVQEFSSTGAFLRQFGSEGTGNGQFIEPTGIAVDSSGNVWVLSTLRTAAWRSSPRPAHTSPVRHHGLGRRADRRACRPRLLRREPVCL